MRHCLIAICASWLALSAPWSVSRAEDLAAEGQRVAGEHCSRCHVVGEANRMGGIGSTPSFKLLRGMPDWEERYSTFFARNPHPAFVTVEGLSPDRALPPNAAPITLTARQVDALMVYVKAMKTD